jgi:hypothetical protein
MTYVLVHIRLALLVRDVADTHHSSQNVSTIKDVRVVPIILNSFPFAFGIGGSWDLTK